jgi:hypothetical protein
VPAPRLSDVLVRDLDPGKAFGLGDHALEQLAVALLDVATVRQPAPYLLDASGESVAGALELGDVEDPRASGGGNGVGNAAPRERGGEELCQLALEPGDLGPQVTARAAASVLADVAGRDCGPRGRGALVGSLGARMVDQFGHELLRPRTVSTF